MAKNNAVNLDITNNADGFDITGGTTPRKITLTGADITLTGSGTNTYTYPSSTDTLVGRASTDTLTNKTLTTPDITNPTGLDSNDVGLSNVTNDAQLPLTGGTMTGALIARDHGTETVDEVINAVYGTSATPPTASTTTEGTVYFQYSV